MSQGGGGVRYEGWFEGPELTEPVWLISKLSVIRWGNKSGVCSYIGLQKPWYKIKSN